MDIKTVTVIGANGSMGSKISAIFASFGNAKVYMVGRDIEKTKKAVLKAIKSVRADSISDNLIPADYSMLDSCINESDLVFESAAENFDVKFAINKQIAEYLRGDAIVCTGTSGLSVEKLSEAFPDHLRGNYFGMHFYNPPYNMNLCEVTPTRYTNKVLFNEIKTYLSDILFRTVVEVKDYPAFIGNRIGFYFINRVLQFAEKYKHSGGIDYIDAVLGPFTGRSMAPLVTSDFVGLDIHKAIVDNIYTNTDDFTHETFVFPNFAQNLINEGKLGRKTNGGLYKIETHENGSKRLMVYDIASNIYRDKINYSFLFVEEMIQFLRIGDYKSAFETLIFNSSIEADICLDFLLKYIIYSLYISINVGNDITSADDVMATGFNWCPPLALIDAFSTVTNFEILLKKRVSDSFLKETGVNDFLSYIKPSKYDYRLYFKAVK